MRVKVVCKAPGKDFTVEGAPDGIGIHKSGNAILIFKKQGVAVELDREVSLALARLFTEGGN
ncbi:MAG: hypothetical protein HQL38_00670 [Alphaproteobacteria bacterium]|nr:hypothetical protein [Alphaproteobacteria bacterium]MBF0373282.1 hypothetical protein [Alphaproteobacteria bacterium]MBF0391167.1 hypothetical protein [Alphaproteobacteria bacterium]